uniref:Reverse transcriptase Ty1/copia-type domain-containing protein n=1 Tax=Tanacetum cinerariifolium TaxID=118510 RepID=A0A6L2L0K3_TANCI|nr:hypothetical protein [Tanacetum cinerariifolium]
MEDGIFISQDKYVNEISNKFSFFDMKTASTLMENNKTLLKDEKGEDIDEHLYRSMIGSLMYLTSSRPNIMFVVCACVRFQVNPKILHLHAVKRIFRYLKGQPKLGLWYHKDSPFDLVAYTNSDYAGASLDRKSTTGGCQFLGCRKGCLERNGKAAKDEIDQLLEASLAEDVKNLVITFCVEIRNEDLHDETERISKESKDVSNESKTADAAKSIAFEIALQHKSRENNSLKTLQKENENFMASLEIENTHLKQTNKDLFESVQRSRVETNHCDEIKVKVNFDEIETKNIELEHRVASLIKENEHLKLTYQSLFDSIKKLRVQTKTSNVTQNEAENLKTAKFEAYFEKLENRKVVLERQLARKVDDSKAKKDQFLKEINHLRTQLENLKGKSVETKFDKSSILGKPPAEKLLITSQLSNLWFTPKIIVQKDLSKPVTAQSLPKNEKYQLLKQIASLESKLATQDIRSCQKEYLELRTLFNALKVKFDSLNQKRKETNVSEKVHTGEPSKPFSRRIHAKVDGKKVIISEATIKRDLKLEDEGGVDWLSNEVIFEQLTLMGVIDLENTKTVQAQEILSLNKMIKRLEKKRRSRTHGLKGLYKVGLSTRVELSAKEQSLDDEEVVIEKAIAVKEVDATQDQVSAGITIVAKDLTIDDITLAKALKALKTSKPKIRGIVPSEATTTTIPIPSKVLDKGKRIMVEEPLKIKKKDQISFDKQESRRLQAELDQEQRLTEEEAQKALDANIVVIEQWHDVQAKIEAGFELAQRLQAEEQEQLTDDEKAKLFMEFLEKRKKFFAAKRAEEKRNIGSDTVQLLQSPAATVLEQVTLMRIPYEDHLSYGSWVNYGVFQNIPPTKAQQRSLMFTYLKNMDGWKPRAFKNKSFAEIKELFDKATTRINKFVDFRTELVKESSKKAEECSLKRAEDELEQENAKKQKVDDDKKATEFKRCLKIVPDDEDDITIDATPFSSKSLTIIDYKIYKERRKSYLQIIKADGSSQMYYTFSKMLKNFIREDLEVLWSIVKARFEKNIVYYLLVKKGYQLTRNTLHQMWNDVRLQIDYEVEMAYDLLILIQKMNIKFRGGLLRLKVFRKLLLLILMTKWGGCSGGFERTYSEMEMNNDDC